MAEYRANITVSKTAIIMAGDLRVFTLQGLGIGAVINKRVSSAGMLMHVVVPGEFSMQMVFRLAQLLKDTLSEPGLWKIQMAGMGECLPYHDNQVSLSKEKKDDWGMPLLDIDASLRRMNIT